MMREDSHYLDWWGFRRRPHRTLDRPIGRWEMVHLGGCVGLVLAFLWFVGLIIFEEFVRPVGLRTSDCFQIVFALAFLPAAAGAFLPRRDTDSWVVNLVTSLRFQGGMHRADVLLTILALVLLVPWIGHTVYGTGTLGPLAFVGSRAVIGTGLAFSIATAIGVALSRFSVSLPFHPRKPPAPVPDWLHPTDDAVDVEADASFEYPFPGPKGATIGIHVPREVLERLRAYNAEAGGVLYQQNARTVVHGSGPPVNETGAGELGRLAAIIGRRATAVDWTRAQLANAVLGFVQIAITYEHDEQSTRRILDHGYVEYGRFALETLVDQVGDCDCTAILCASLLSYLGFDCALLYVKIHHGAFQGTTGHLAVGLRADQAAPLRDALLVESAAGSYLYGETAIDSTEAMPFGVLPPEEAARFEFDEVVEIPALTPRGG